MVQELTTNPSVFGRLGKGLAQGLADTVPKEIERNRMASGLKRFAQESGGRNQIENLAELASIPGALNSPQLIKSFSDLARQQAIINSTNQQQNQQPKQNQQQNLTTSGIPLASPAQQAEATPQSATTKEGVRAALNPYIPPTAQEKELMARQLLAQEPYIYPDIETARAAIDRNISAETQKSNAEIQARDYEQNVQTRAEQELTNEINRLGGKGLPGEILSDIENEAIESVRSGKLTEKQAAKVYGKKAQEIDRDIATMNSWGGIGLISNKPKELLSAIENVKDSFHKNGYKRQFEDLLVAKNGITPQFASAINNPVKNQKDLNGYMKSLPDLKTKIEKVQGVPGLAGLGSTSPKNSQQTLKIAPELAKLMGNNGSPLSIAYELDKKGYDSQVWKDYLNENKDKLDLKQSQLDQLKKTQNSFYGWLNDLWLQSFTGIE